MKNKAVSFIAIPILVISSLLAFFPEDAVRSGSAFAAEEEGTNSYAEFNQSILEMITAERELISQRKSQSAQLQASFDALKSDLNSYRLQLSTHGNLLLLPTPEVDPLEKASALNQTSLEQIQKQLKEIDQQLETLAQESSKNDEQLRINKDQLTRIKGQKPSVPDAADLIKNIGILVQLLTEKQKYLADLTAKYTKQKEALEEVQKGFSSLTENFEIQIKNSKKQLLFQRGDSPLRITQWLQLSAEFHQLRNKTNQLFSIPYWREEFNAIWEIEGLLLFTSTLLIIILTVVSVRIRRYARALAERPFYSENPWRRLGFRLFMDALPLLGLILLLYVFITVRKVNSSSVLLPLQSILIIVLLTRWCLESLRKLPKFEPPAIPPPHVPKLRSLAIAIRWFAAIYVVMDWMITGTSFTLFLLRAFFEIWLLFWGLSVRKQIERPADAAGEPLPPKKGPFRQVLVGLCYIIFVVGPLLELTGFGEFAWYFYHSLGHTIVVFLWWAILFSILREWDQPFAISPAQDGLSVPTAAQPVRWVLFRICWLLWAVSFILSLLLAWGARQHVFTGLAQALNHEIEIGQMQLSVMGFIYAFLLLFITHLLVKTLRPLLKKKILIKSGLERGLQESIINVTVYIIWGIGILLSLHAVGVNTASMAVVLGAMSIGLGFGLQNIFNNFISGIILLFERPIQVGDDVEVNGVWAKVQKINVRSTVVQTADNASIIIPNSEFISSHVTNWSFKDRRLRRKITVGVAYGSDTQLVKRTLLEIAENTPGVLKIPAPDVLFSDFGDSALVFILRFWTTVDRFLVIESDIRHEIDRLFTERNINIPFPQRDIRVYNQDGIRTAPEDLSGGT